MYYYKRTITSGTMIEVEVYKSIKKRDRKAVARSLKHSVTPDKMKAANDIRAKKKCRRLIAKNFIPGDCYLTLSFFESLTEDEANRLVDNFLRRLRYYRRRHGMDDLKFIGCLECGKRGNRWHAHIVVNKIALEVVSALWNCGRVFCEALYEDGGFKDLANYIRKDVTGKKRLKQSRNLLPPDEEVREMKKKEIKEIEAGVVPPIPAGYYIAAMEQNYNDFTGTSFVFTMLPVGYRTPRAVN
jgi:hypothetical protein